MICRLFILTVVFGAGLACGEREIVYKDRDVVFDYDPEAALASQEKALIPGIYEEQLFRALEDDDPLHIVAGFQGGIWVHMSLRVTGMRSRGQIEATLNPGGTTAFSLKMVRTAEGYLEAYDIPIPVGGRGESLDDIEELFGAPSTLTFRYSADDVTLTSERQVILERG